MPDLGLERWRATEKPDRDAVEWSFGQMELSVGGRQKNQSLEEEASNTAVLQSPLFFRDKRLGVNEEIYQRRRYCGCNEVRRKL